MYSTAGKNLSFFRLSSLKVERLSFLKVLKVIVESHLEFGDPFSLV